MRQNRQWLAMGLVTCLLLVGCGADEPGDDAADDSGLDPTNNDAPDGPSDQNETPSDVNQDAYFYDQTIEIIVPFTAGGGTDGVSRVIAQYLQEHIAGNPNVQVTNIAGGAAMLGPNQFKQQRQPDGKTLIFTSDSGLLSWLFDHPAAEFDIAEDFHPLWISSRGNTVVYAHESTGIEDASELNESDSAFHFGGPSAHGVTLAPILSFEMLGWQDKINYIFGYEGSGAIEAAFQAGELNLARRATPDFLLDYGDGEGEANLLYSFGEIDSNGELTRDSMVPDAPHVGEVYEALHGRAPAGPAFDAFMMLHRIVGTGGWSISTHSDAPPEAIQALEEGFASMVADEQYIEDALPRTGPVTPGVGDDAKAWLENVQNIDASSVQWIRTLLEEMGEPIS